MSGLWLIWLLAAPPDALRAQADARRAAAEAALGAARAAQLEGQAKLTARLEAAQRALSAARRRADAAAAALAAAEADRAGSARQATDRKRAHEALGAQLAALAAVGPRLDALAAGRRVRVTPARVFDRRGAVVEVPVVHLGAVRRLAAGSTADTVGRLEGPPGEARIAGPALSSAEAAALRAAAAGDLAAVPLDVTGALSAGVGEGAWTLQGWLLSGGVMVWPIVAVGLLGLLITLERAIVLAAGRTPWGLPAAICAAIDAGRDPRPLLTPRRAPVVRVLHAGVLAPPDQLEAALEAALVDAELRLDRGLRILAVLAAVAPLLGLLGTVTGMIATFDVIALHGTGEPRLLSGGIAQALVTTQLGLIVAVPCLLSHAILSRAIRGRLRRAEQAAAILFGARSAAG